MRRRRFMLFAEKRGQARALVSFLIICLPSSSESLSDACTQWDSCNEIFGIFFCAQNLSTLPFGSKKTAWYINYNIFPSPLILHSCPAFDLLRISTNQLLFFVFSYLIKLNYIMAKFCYWVNWKLWRARDDNHWCRQS